MSTLTTTVVHRRRIPPRLPHPAARASRRGGSDRVGDSTTRCRRSPPSEHAAGCLRRQWPSPRRAPSRAAAPSTFDHELSFVVPTAQSSASTRTGHVSPERTWSPQQRRRDRRDVVDDLCPLLPAPGSLRIRFCSSASGGAPQRREVSPPALAPARLVCRHGPRHSRFQSSALGATNHGRRPRFSERNRLISGSPLAVTLAPSRLSATRVFEPRAAQRLYRGVGPQEPASALPGHSC